MAISKKLRALVIQRADYRCEYCRMHQEHVAKTHEPDHIIPRKHGGPDEDDNLAWSCFICNKYKSSEVGAYDLETGELVPFFNPRSQLWDDHFLLDSGKIVPRTATGRVTERIFQLNRPDRLEARNILTQAGLYP